MSSPYPMFKSTVTVFNKYKNVWYPTVIEDCHVITDKSAITAAYGSSSGDTTQLHVMYRNGTESEIPDGVNVYIPEYEIVFVGDKMFLPPKAWKRASSKENVFTFSPLEDFILLGITDSDVDCSGVIQNDLYVRNSYLGFLDYMNHVYDDVYSVSSWAKYRFLKHFEVMAK